MKITSFSLLAFASLIASASSLQAQSMAQLQADIASLKAQVAALLPLKALVPYVTVDPNPENGVKGPNIVFHGANVHIVDGSGTTNLLPPSSTDYRSIVTNGLG